MSSAKVSSFPLVAVDVGNSRVKLGLFESLDGPHGLPEPAATLTLTSDLDPLQLGEWLRRSAEANWLIASVQRATSAALVDRLQAANVHNVRHLVAADLPLTINVPEPERVGIDRLVNAVGANCLRAAGHGAIVIDIGSAITIDSVSENGDFLGGAILPGIGMSARALHEFTDLLPLSEMTELHDAPNPLGTNTVAALRSGLFWGAVGGMREIAGRFASQLSQLSQPHVFLTGGAAPSVAQYLVPPDGQPAQFVPHLTLAGVALSAAR